MADRLVRLAEPFALKRGWLELSPEVWSPTFHPERPWGLAPDRILVPLYGRPVTPRDAQAALRERDAMVAYAAPIQAQMREGWHVNGRARADAAEQARGFRTGSWPCASCNAFKSRPSAVCTECGDEPYSFNGDPRDFDRAHGYA
jgi:hypothetical protein